MIPLRERGAQTIAEVWNASVPSKYWIDTALVDQNLLQHPLLHEEASLWWEGTFVAVKRSAGELYEGPNARVAHVALLGGGAVDHPRPDQFPSFPLLSAIEILREEGYEALVIGQDSGHFLPGAPTDVPWVSKLQAFGFERGGLGFDLERDVRDVQVGPLVVREGTHRSLEAEDIPSLDGFLRREFPGRWRYDVMRKVEAEGPQTVFGLWIDGSLQGFALLQDEGCRLPIGGAAWKADLGNRWGSLGPIGVASDLRGDGRGSELLNLALVKLRDRGARRTIIDWTGLVDFYGTQGFSVARTYRAYRLNLLADPQS